MVSLMSSMQHVFVVMMQLCNTLCKGAACQSHCGPFWYSLPDVCLQGLVQTMWGSASMERQMRRSFLQTFRLMCSQ